MDEHYLFALAGVVILGIGAQWLAWRLKLPSILLLLVFGFIAGPLTGFLKTDELLGNLLIPVVSIAVAIILFEGGLTLTIKALPKIGNVLFLLLTVGVLITWLIATLSAHLVIGLNFQIAVLLGAVLVVTGPTVIGPLLKYIRPKGKVADILKWEGIVTDPIGALFALIVFEVILSGGFQEASLVILINIGGTILFGSLTGVLFAGILILLIKKYWVPDFLQETVTLSLVIAAFVVSNILQSESGLFATTVMGIIMANQRFVAVKHILEFKENLAVLIISFIFIILSARLELKVFEYISYSSFIFLLILVFVARPISVFASTYKSKISFQEKLFLSWMAPRGIIAAAVSSIFALRLSKISIPQTEFLVPITFIVIVGTVVLYGLTSAPLARFLKVAQSSPQGVLFVGAHLWALEMAKAIKSNGFNAAVIDTNRVDIYNAQLAKIDAYHGSVLSERLTEEIRLDGIGKMIALTSNDEANSLACLHLKDLFDSKELFQLKPIMKSKVNEIPFSPQYLRGRYVFGEKINFSVINDLISSGHVIKTIKFTDGFDYKSFMSFYNNEVIPLFLITEDKQLRVVTTDSSLVPKINQSIIAIVPFKDNLTVDG